MEYVDYWLRLPLFLWRLSIERFEKEVESLKEEIAKLKVSS